MPGIVQKGDHIIYYSSPAGYVNKHIAVVDNMFHSQEMENWLAKRQLQADWRDGVYERLAAAGLAEAFGRGEEAPEELKSCRVWRLRNDVDFGMRLKDFRAFQNQYGTPDRNDYDIIFDGQVETNDLHKLDEKFSDHPPRGFDGHPLAMGDVMELYDSEGSDFYYADRQGFYRFEFAESSTGPALEMGGL